MMFYINFYLYWAASLQDLLGGIPCQRAETKSQANLLYSDSASSVSDGEFDGDLQKTEINSLTEAIEDMKN